MSNISPQGEQSTSAEIATLTALAALATSGTSQAIRKTGPTTFANVTTSGAWTGPELLTLAADLKTFTLSAAPTSVVMLWGGHQPQIYGVDFTGTINGTNKTFVYATAQDASVASDQYALYQ